METSKAEPRYGSNIRLAGVDDPTDPRNTAEARCNDFESRRQMEAVLLVAMNF